MRIIIFICISWLLLTSTVYAGSTALSESKFLVQGDPGSVISQVLTVSNLSDQAQSYRFYPDEPGEAVRQRISLSPSEFQLQPGQSLDVMVRFRQGKDNWRAYLNLVAVGLEQARSNFHVADGIKIPVIFAPPRIAGAQTQKDASKPELLLWNALIFSIDFILFFIVCYWYYRRFKKGVTLKCHSPHPNKINFL